MMHFGLSEDLRDKQDHLEEKMIAQQNAAAAAAALYGPRPGPKRPRHRTRRSTRGPSATARKDRGNPETLGASHATAWRPWHTA
jgi:hypothetical protein